MIEQRRVPLKPLVQFIYEEEANEVTHIVSKHVHASDDQMMARVTGPKAIKQASQFADPGLLLGNPAKRLAGPQQLGMFTTLAKIGISLLYDAHSVMGASLFASATQRVVVKASGSSSPSLQSKALVKTALPPTSNLEAWVVQRKTVTPMRQAIGEIIFVFEIRTVGSMVEITPITLYPG